MITETITMTPEQLRGLLTTVPASAHVCKTSERVTVSAKSRKTKEMETVIDAVKKNDGWEVTAPVGLIDTVVR